MIREWRLFLIAVQFLTRIPAPGPEVLPTDWLARSAKYFPAVGALTGTLSALVLLGAGAVWRSGPLPALLALSVGLLLTGALHEDGLADTADALGGGRSPEQRLAIMKDPRVGAYGVITLGLVLSGKVTALASLPLQLGAAGLIGAHMGGRAAAAWAMSFLPYATDPAASKVGAASRALRSWELGLALLLAALPSLLLLPVVAGAACMAAATFSAWLVGRTSARLIGGHTGDVLGAVEQIYELTFLVLLSGLQAAGLLLR